MKKYLLATLALFASVAFVSCEQDSPKKISITLSDVNFETPWDIYEVGVSVEDNGEWSVTAQPEWLNVERNENKLTLSTGVNDSFRERKGKITITYGRQNAYINVWQKGAEISVEIVYSSGLPANGVSSNGRYVVGTYNSSSFVYDRATKQIEYLGDGKGVVNPDNMSLGHILIYDISDNGLAVGAAGINGGGEGVNLVPFSYDVNTKKFNWLSFEGVPAGATSGTAWSISADGSVIAGYVGYPISSDAQLSYIPVVWRNGVAITLGHDEAGLGDGDKPHGYTATGLSDDGSIIVGYLSTRFSARVGCYWRLSEPDKVNFFLRDNEEFYHTVLNTTVNKLHPDRYPRIESISADGKTFSCTLIDGSLGVLIYTPFTYNVETKEIVKSSNGDALASFTMPNSGEFVYVTPGIPGSGVSRTTYFHKNSEAQTLEDWLLNVHNISKLPDGNYTLRDVSSDGRVLVGFETTGGFKTVVISL